MKRVLLLIEPLAILLIGIAIGTVVLGIVLAITSLSDIPL
jgi:general secretion pathway protein F